MKWPLIHKKWEFYDETGRVNGLSNVDGVSEKVWKIVVSWDYFAKDTVGKQLVRAVDSIASNLSEGFGRYHFRETVHFGYYSRGSLFETKTWLVKAFNRNYFRKKSLISSCQPLMRSE